MTTELERLRRWKAEALVVLEGWDEVAALVPPVLGEPQYVTVRRELLRLQEGDR